MSTEPQTLELVPQGEELPTKRADTVAIWSDFKTQAEKLKTTAETLTVTDVSQVAEMKLARATRLALKELRVSVEHKRKELGEHYLRETKKINAAATELKEIIEPLETRLLEQEQFVEREFLRICGEKRTSRTAELTPFLTAPCVVDLGAMKDEDYASLLQSTKDAHQAKIDREKREKEEAEAKAKAEAEERERIRLENERLKKEAEERDEQAKKEREEAIELARVEKEKADAEIARVKSEAEAKATAERERVAMIENRILAIREGETDAIRFCKTVELLEKEIAYVEAREINEELFQERLEEAKEIRTGVLVSMRKILSDKKAQEAASEKARKELEAANKKAQEEANRAAEEARIAAEKAQKEILKATAEKATAEKKAKAERDAAEAKATQEREAREKLQAEIDAKKAAEEKAEADRKETERKAALAPAKEKLMAYAKEVRILSLKTFDALKTADVKEVAEQAEKFAKWIEKKAGEL